MDIVMTTPHGDADIRVTNQRATTTLAELIVAATGQAAPAVVRLDGRTIATSTTLDRIGLRRGSVLDTVAPTTISKPATLTTLAQIAGPGAGRRHPLGGGRHHLGPGRRVNAAELSSAPVEDPAVTIDVDTDGSVTVHPIDGHPLALRGSPVTAPTPWTDGAAVIDDRAFVIERTDAAPTTGDRRGEVETDTVGAGPGPDGWIAFHRRPRSAGPTERRPAIDAVHDATTHGPGLWQRRPDHVDAFVLPIGVSGSGGPPRVISIDLVTNTTVSITGPRRTALARAMLLEVVTLHGPADLDVVVATARTGIVDWDWAKWLPHARATDGSGLLRGAREIAAWVDAITEHSRLTLLVVDDPGLWQPRDSPLHRLLTKPPDHIRIVTLGAAAADAPPTATVLLTDDRDRGWRLVTTTTTDDEHVLAALVETDVARRAAIAMAALDDQEAPVRPTTSRDEPRPLRSIVAPDGGPTRVAVLDEVAAGAVIVGTDHETARTAAVLALRQCLARSCWLLDLLGSPWTAGLDGLAGRSDTSLDSGTVDADRLLVRLRHHLADTSTQIVVLVDGDQEAGARVMASSAELGAVTVLATASSEPVGTTLPVIRVERREGRREATIVIGGVGHVIALDDDPDTEELSVRALVSGRPLTALERRIEREVGRHPERFVEQCRAIVGEFADRAGSRPPVLARPPFVAPLHVESLFARYPGDGIPIGIVDDPSNDHDALWWQPGQGHLVAIGPGLDGLLGTVATGLGDRYGDDEVEIIDAFAVTAIDQTPDDEAVAALLDRLDRTEDEDGAFLVVVVDDLGVLRRRANHLDGRDRLDSAFASGRFDLVGLAPTLEDAGTLADGATTTLLVASPGDERGRCRLAPEGRLVQLAEPDRSGTLAESTGPTP